MNCEFCGKLFGKAKALAAHTKRGRRCIEVQIPDNINWEYVDVELLKKWRENYIKFVTRCDDPSVTPGHLLAQASKWRSACLMVARFLANQNNKPYDYYDDICDGYAKEFEILKKRNREYIYNRKKLRELKNGVDEEREDKDSGEELGTGEGEEETKSEGES